MDRLRAALRGSPEDDFAYGEGIPEDATWRNLLPMAEFGLGMAPVSGEAIAARDAWDASGRAGNALLSGDYGEAASDYLNMGTGLLGAIPGAGIIARGTKRGAAWMDRNLPEGFNRLLDSVYPQGYVPNDTAAAFPGWHGSPHDYPAERLVRKQDGTTEFISGQPDVLPDIPPGHDLIQDFPLGRMRLDKIGTGEGAQVYGHGLYLAENPAVAQEYQKALVKKQPIPQDAIPEGGDYYAKLKYEFPPDALETAEKKLRASIEDMKDAAGDARFPYRQEAAIADLPRLHKELETLEQVKALPGGTRQGNLYRAEIDAEPEDLLDWDLPLNQQSEKIQSIVRPLFTKENGLGHIQDIDHLPGENIVKLLTFGLKPDGTAAALREAGIPGIRYLDQMSRDAGEGSRNFVIFDDKLVKMLGKE